MTEEREFDVVLLGATGFTGQLTAEVLARQSAEENFRWAIAGRNEEKLTALATRLAATHGTPPTAIQASVGDVGSLESLARRTRVLATTVGPYLRYGHPVVDAAVAAGCDYVDITGEPQFVDTVIERHDQATRKSGQRIVSCCGFDSVPHDLGALVAVRALGADEPIVLEGIVQARGDLSGGTWHSAVNAMSRSDLDDAMKVQRGDGRHRLRRPKVRRDKRLGGWVVPMPTIDPLVVLRSSYELPDYGPEFRYSHSMKVGSFGRLAAGGAVLSGVFVMAKLPPTRKLLYGWRKPGQGPDEETRAKSRFKVTFFGKAGDREVSVEVSGGDPGYGETSKMLAHSALALAMDRPDGPGGVLTPAAAMGDELLARLRGEGLRFDVV